MRDSLRRALPLVLALLAGGCSKAAPSPTTAASTRTIHVEGGVFVKGGDVLRGESVYLFGVDGVRAAAPKLLGSSGVDGRYSVDFEIPAQATIAEVGVKTIGGAGHSTMPIILDVGGTAVPGPFHADISILPAEMLPLPR